MVHLPVYDRAESRFAPIQWETPLLCNDVPHWLGTNLESALYAIHPMYTWSWWFANLSHCCALLGMEKVYPCKSSTWSWPIYEADMTQLQGGVSKTLISSLNQRALKLLHLNKIHIFQCMGKIFCVEFQRVPLKFHTKYLAHTFLTWPAVNIAVNKIDIWRVRYHFSHDRVTIVWLLWCHQHSIVTSSAEYRMTKWAMGTVGEDRCLYSCLWIRYVV